MNILAVDTAGKTAAVAVLRDDTLLYEAQCNNGLTHSETKPESADSAASAAEPAPLAESEVNDAILATAGDSAAASAVAEEAAPVEGAAESTPAESTEASSESPAA